MSSRLLSGLTLGKKLNKYCNLQGDMHDKNNGFYFGWLDLLAPWLQDLFNHT
jgi:hypothetical protein